MEKTSKFILFTFNRFSFRTSNEEDREFDIKAENEEIRNKWFKCLTMLIPKQKRKETDTMSVNSNTSNMLKPRPTRNQNRVTNADMSSMLILQNSGFIFNDKKEEDLSHKCLSLKNISKDNFPDLSDQHIKDRIQYGFLEKRHKSKLEFYQKRWVFLTSSRPLNDYAYEADEESLEHNILPNWMDFDILYYFKAENEEDKSESRGSLNLAECNGIEIRETDDKFYIFLDYGDRFYQFQHRYKAVRDLWFDALRISRKTAKDKKNSITSNPRNTNKLLNIYEKSGIGKIYTIAENEKSNILKNMTNILDYSNLQISIYNLQNFLFKTLDGLLLNLPLKHEIFKTYIETFNTGILECVQSYWINTYKETTVPNIIELSLFLFKQEKLYEPFGVTDSNFSINARELIKVFCKKSFFLVREIIETILKKEREVKHYKASDNCYYTYGPKDLYNIVNETFKVLKPTKNNIIYENGLFLAKECILQYLIGVDCLISNHELDIEKEFLIAIVNNTVTINNYISELIENVTQTHVLNEKEIEEAICAKGIAKWVNILADFCANRVANELMENLIDEEFNDVFMNLNEDQILKKILEIFENYLHLFHKNIRKKFGYEIAKILVTEYINNLLISKKKANVNFIIEKMKKDQTKINDVCFGIFGENLTREALKAIDNILEFLEVDTDFIGVSCSKLDKVKGFNLTTAKMLIELRTDLSKDQKRDALKTCKEILQNSNKKTSKDTDSSANNALYLAVEADSLQKEYFQDKDEEDYLEERDVMLSPKAAPKNSFKALNRARTVNLTEFLTFDEDEITENLPDPFNLDEDDKSVYANKDRADSMKVSDVIVEGFINKKSDFTWQKRFFQLKNGFLYWYKTKKSIESQNSFKLKSIKKMQSLEKNQFNILLYDERLYKFDCLNLEDKEKWVNSISSEMNKFKAMNIKNNEKKIEIQYDAVVKKKVIEDFNNHPSIDGKQAYMKEIVQKAIELEDFFKKK